MKRWVIARHGRGGLRIDEAPMPSPSAGEVLVRVSAVALNARDLMIIDEAMGLDLEFPFVPASDMAGVVEAVGDGVTRFAPGARVISNFIPARIDGRPEGTAQEPSYRTLGGHYQGVLAEYVSFPEGWFTAAPATLDDGEASTLPVAGLTAWFSLIEMGRLRAGETVLLSGTGGVAMFALQIAVRTALKSSSPRRATRSSGVPRRLGRRTESIAAQPT